MLATVSNFENGGYEITRNNDYVILLKFAWNSHEITSDELIYGGFKTFKTTVCN